MDRLLSWLHLLPSLPPPVGPCPVGTLDCEIPVSSIPPSLVSEFSPDVALDSLLFRVYYPCERAEKQPKQCPSWIPHGKAKDYLTAYAHLLGLSGMAATIFANMIEPLSRVRMPIFPQAPVHYSTPGKMPVMIFSHGVAGTRNTYSHLLSSMASHGLAVFALEHRDGSAPVTFVSRKTKLGQAVPENSEMRTQTLEVDELVVEQTEIKHQAHAHQFHVESEKGRDMQLEIRCRELGELYDAIKCKAEISAHTKKAERSTDSDIEEESGDSTDRILREICSNVDLDRVVWSGHSFGAATIVQFLKSCYNTAQRSSQPLFDPHLDHPLSGSRTLNNNTAVILFDLWCVPLVSVRTLPLAAQCLPSRPLVILSEEFRNLKVNVQALEKFLSSKMDDPVPLEKLSRESRFGSALDSEDPSEPESAILLPGGENDAFAAPAVFYIKSSAHISQSDIGLLFPLLTYTIYKSAPSKAILELNIHTAVTFLREKKLDMEQFMVSPESTSYDFGLLEECHISQNED